ncbi:MAG: membrane protein insertase YidC [Patescibacteria group bacterium]|nr:membrane protein insertase YidC [Patescibacteria group bacterium]MDE2438504.1 membrane protein insertase YidC [Patescibacteria group bacterium]
MVFLYNEIIVRPLTNLLFFIYHTAAFSDAGIAIILFTIVVRLAIFPIFHKNMRYQMVLSKLQPEMAKIQKEHKDDKEAQVKAMMHLYERHKINPFSGFLFIIVQVVLLITLYRISMKAFSSNVQASLYSFIHITLPVHHTFLGLFDVNTPLIEVALVAALLQFIQSKFFMPNTAGGEAAQMMSAMIFVFPLLTLIILVKLPAVVGLYWIASTVFSIGEYVVTKRIIQSESLETEIKQI